MPTINEAQVQISTIHQQAEAHRHQWHRIIDLAVNAVHGDDEAYSVRWIRNHLDMIEASIKRG